MQDSTLKKFSDALLDYQDTDNLIIKGHILTEYCLDTFIHFHSKEKLDARTKFTYSNKIEIAQILGLFIKHKDLKRELKLLNKLRNSIAHTLEYDKIVFNQLLQSYKKINTQSISEMKDESVVYMERKKDVYFEKINDKFIERGGRVKVNGGHIKFMALVMILCSSIYHSTNNEA